MDYESSVAWCGSHVSACVEINGIFFVNTSQKEKDTKAGYPFLFAVIIASAGSAAQGGRIRFAFAARRCTNGACNKLTFRWSASEISPKARFRNCGARVLHPVPKCAIIYLTQASNGRKAVEKCTIFYTIFYLIKRAARFFLCLVHGIFSILRLRSCR